MAEQPSYRLDQQLVAERAARDPSFKRQANSTYQTIGQSQAHQQNLTGGQRQEFENMRAEEALAALKSAAEQENALRARLREREAQQMELERMARTGARGDAGLARQLRENQRDIVFAQEEINRRRREGIRHAQRLYQMGRLEQGQGDVEAINRYADENYGQFAPEESAAGGLQKSYTTYPKAAGGGIAHRLVSATQRRIPPARKGGVKAERGGRQDEKERPHTLDPLRAAPIAMAGAAEDTARRYQDKDSFVYRAAPYAPAAGAVAAGANPLGGALLLGGALYDMYRRGMLPGVGGGPGVAPPDGFPTEPLDTGPAPDELRARNQASSLPSPSQFPRYGY